MGCEAALHHAWNGQPSLRHGIDPTPSKAARPRNKRCRALQHPCPSCWRVPGAPVVLWPASANNGALICFDFRLLNATDQAVLVGVFLHLPWSPARCGSPPCSRSPLILFREGHPGYIQHTQFQLSSIRQSPHPPSLRLKGSRPEVPHPCVLDLYLHPASPRGQSRLSWCNRLLPDLCRIPCFPER
jgi:hypothetical protein